MAVGIPCPGTWIAGLGLVCPVPQCVTTILRTKSNGTRALSTGFLDLVEDPSGWGVARLSRV